jgi:lipoyl synthase
MTLAKPDWLRKKLPLGAAVQSVEAGLSSQRLHTICQEGCCPNQGECFERGVATFLIMGDTCTRNCGFCAVKHGKPSPLDMGEPERLALEVKEMKLRFVVVTSVTRDDLPDGGASHFARTIASLRIHCPGVGVEVLIPDFQGSKQALDTIVMAAPEVVGHNIETVPRLYRAARPQADYARSLRLLREIKAMVPEGVTKSGLMVGLGETAEEVAKVLSELRDVGCDMLTIGQYLGPSVSHHPVVEYVRPEIFDFYRRRALDLGFRSVAASPFVRSSYMAEKYFSEMSA